MLAWLTPTRILIIVLGLALAVQTWRVSTLKAWQGRVVEATSSAADIRRKDGSPGRLATNAVVPQIRAFGQFVRDTKDARAKAKASDQANVIRVERTQTQVNEETSNDYQKKLADLRRRADALRLRRPATAANPGGGGKPRVSGVPDAAGGPDGASGENGFPDGRLDAADALIASEQALRLQALQEWVRRQAAIDRRGDLQ